MATFNIKQITVPLFGVIDSADPHQWRRAFATNQQQSVIEIDEPALEILADELGIHADGIVSDARQYVRGEYREKASGISGGLLGELGEILTYRSEGVNISRVVHWMPANGQTIKGNRFPQPDFLIDTSGKLVALEVKSTEAFNFLELRDSPKRWLWLQPCLAISRCREAALPQLGFLDNIHATQAHSLVQQDGKVVPFPVDIGIAVAVASVDGRTKQLRNIKKLKTPTICRDKKRDCWQCVDEKCNFFMTKMPNAPGYLSLPGQQALDRGRWMRAYRRWTLSLSAKDSFTSKSSAKHLEKLSDAWLQSLDKELRATLRGFWGAYLQETMLSHGIPVSSTEYFGGVSEEWRKKFGWRQPSSSGQLNEEVEIDEFVRRLNSSFARSNRFLISSKYSGERNSTASVSAWAEAEFVEVKWSSVEWLRDGEVSHTEAQRILSQFLSFVIFGTAIFYRRFQLSLRECSVNVDRNSILLGWAIESLDILNEDYRRRPLEGIPSWFSHFAARDPRIRLYLSKEGIASLRISRSAASFQPMVHYVGPAGTVRPQTVEQSTGALRRQLAEIGASAWGETAGLKVAWVHGRCWLEQGRSWQPAPWNVKEVEEALMKVSRSRDMAAEMLPSEWASEVMMFYELATLAQVIRYLEDLDRLMVHWPQLELARREEVWSQILARWRPPQLDGDILAFYASAPAKKQADLVFVQIDIKRWSIAIDIVHGGLFELAQ